MGHWEGHDQIDRRLEAMSRLVRIGMRLFSKQEERISRHGTA